MKRFPFSMLVVACVPGLWLSATGCASAPDSDEVLVGEDMEDLIGGQQAYSAAFNAVGAIFGPGPDGKPLLFCTATLIAKDRILATPNCFKGEAGPASVRGAKHTFRIGHDASAPNRVVKIRSWVNSEGTFDGPALGSLAIGYLEAPINDISPLPVAAFGAADVGKRFAVVGYGDKIARADGVAPKGTPATRSVGTMTLRAIAGGNKWKTQYPNFAAFLADSAKYDGKPALANDPKYQAERKAEWERKMLAHEVVLGGRSGDSFATGGDTGGPILGQRNGKLTVLAVAQKWEYLGPRPEPFNPFFMPLTGTTLAQAERHFIDSRSACGLISARGTCTGETVVRCSLSNEGPPRLLRTECATLGLHCSKMPLFGEGEIPVTCDAPCAGPDAYCEATGGKCAPSGACKWPYSF